MKTEKAQLALSVDDESAYTISESSTVVLASNLPSEVWFSVPDWPGGSIVTSATVDIRGTVFVYAEPTGQFLTIYPELESEPVVDILEDLDIPFKPLKTRTVKGVVAERKRARFTTAFIDALVEDVDIA